MSTTIRTLSNLSRAIFTGPRSCRRLNVTSNLNNPTILSLSSIVSLRKNFDQILNSKRYYAGAAANAASFDASASGPGSGNGKSTTKTETPDSSDKKASSSAAKSQESKDYKSDSSSSAEVDSSEAGDDNSNRKSSKSKSNDSELDSANEKIDSLTLQLEEQKEKVKELISQLRYAHADAENARKRHNVEIQNAKDYGINKFAGSVCEVADNLERALETVKNTSESGKEDYLKKLEENPDLKALYDGVKLTDEILMKTFSQYNISKLSPMGEKFDPKLHEAMFQLDSDEPKDTIVHLMQPGWKIKDRLLRAARVGTSRGPKE